MSPISTGQRTIDVSIMTLRQYIGYGQLSLLLFSASQYNAREDIHSHFVEVAVIKGGQRSRAMKWRYICCRLPIFELGRILTFPMVR